MLLNEWFLVLRGDGKSPDTLGGYGRSLKQLSAFLAAGGFPQLALATAEHLREWLNALRDKGNKPATVNTRYRAVHRFYEWLRSEGEAQENPMARIEPPRVPDVVQPHYSQSDIQRVLKSLSGRRLRGADAARTRVIVLMLFDTGMRASELCGLRTEDVNWEAQTIVLRTTKGGDQRVVSIGTATARALAAYLRVRGAAQPWLFTSLDGRRLTKNALKLALRRAFDAAGVDFKGIHSFRRACGIEYLRQGGQAEDLRVLMGWKSPEMMRRYVSAAEVGRATVAHKKFSPSDALERVHQRRVVSACGPRSPTILGIIVVLETIVFNTVAMVTVIVAAMVCMTYNGLAMVMFVLPVSIEFMMVETMITVVAAARAERPLRTWHPPPLCWHNDKSAGLSDEQPLATEGAGVPSR